MCFSKAATHACNEPSSVFRDANGNSRFNSSINSPSDRPNWIAQIPRSVAATIILPRGESTHAYRIAAAIAPRRYLSGVMPSCDAVRSYNRLLAPYPASYMARVTVSPACRFLLSVRSRQESAYSRGVIPSAALNFRCR